jgi:hypothetical protein
MNGAISQRNLVTAVTAVREANTESFLPLQVSKQIISIRIYRERKGGICLLGVPPVGRVSGVTPLQQAPNWRRFSFAAKEESAAYAPTLTNASLQAIQPLNTKGVSHES